MIEPDINVLNISMSKNISNTSIKILLFRLILEKKVMASSAVVFAPERLQLFGGSRGSDNFPLLNFFPFIFSLLLNLLHASANFNSFSRSPKTSLLVVLVPARRR